jgi:hypothetical protein
MKTPTQITEYGCCHCQKWHRKGLDHEYDEHIYFQGKHQGPRERVAKPGEIFALEMLKETASESHS